MMNLIVQEEPEDNRAGVSHHAARAGHELTVVLSCDSSTFPYLIADHFQRLLDFADHALPIGGIAGMFGGGIFISPWSGLRSTNAFDTNVHADQLALDTSGAA